MPLEYVLARVVRLSSGVSATFGLTKPQEAYLAGSPFLARVYRVPQTTVGRDEAQPGTATLDEMQRMSILDPTCSIQVNDIAYLPLPNGTTQRAKIIRCRRYADRVQYDLETGAEGDTPVGAGGLSTLPPPVSTQSQIDALQAQNDTMAAQLGDLSTMFHLLKTGTYTPATTITASTTLTKPAQSTTYPVDTTSGAVVITLYASTGDGTDLEFVRVAGTNPVTFVLNSTTPDTCPLPLVNTALNNIGETQSFREVPGHIMEAH